MYEKFYGFSEEPFNFGPDPKFLYLAPSHSEVLSRMLSSVRGHNGITVVTGDPGVGKTTLVRALLSKLGKNVSTAFIVFTLLSFEGLLKSIFNELRVSAQGQDTSALLDEFHLYLSKKRQNEIISVIIDEAQGLGTHVLRNLVRLWETPDPRKTHLQIILIGQPELDAKLDSDELRSLNEKITMRRHIGLLTNRESNAYIEHRLKMVGSSASHVFRPEALDLICTCASGNPRVINMICDRSFLVGLAKSKRQINSRIVEEAIKELMLPKNGVKRQTPEELIHADGSRGGTSMTEADTARNFQGEPAHRLAPRFHSLTPVWKMQTSWRRQVYRFAESLRSLISVWEGLVSGWQLMHQLAKSLRSSVPVLLTASRRNHAAALIRQSGLESSRTTEPVGRQTKPVGSTSALKQVAGRTLLFQPVYRLAAGSLLLTAALGFFILSMSDRSPVDRNTLDLYPPKETKGNGEPSAIVEKPPAVPLPAERSDPAPVPNITVDTEAVPYVAARQAESTQRAPGSKREVPQRVIASKRGAAPPSALRKPEERPRRIAVQDQRETVAPVSHTVEESSQRIAPARPRVEADPDALLLKQDAAWLMLNR